MAKKINRQLVQDILAKGDEVKTVSSDAVGLVHRRGRRGCEEPRRLRTEDALLAELQKGQE